MDNDKQPPVSDNSLDSLEDPGTVIEQPNSVPSSLAQPPVQPAPSSDPSQPTPTPKSGGPSVVERFRNRLKSVNLYLLLFVFVLVLVAAIAVIAYRQGSHSSSNGPISSQPLDQKALEELANTDATVGSSAQLLNVQSNTFFAGKVLVRDTLEVAGQLRVGGSLSLSGVTVSGSSSFDQVQVNKNLAVGGDTSLQNSLTVQKNVNVTGNGSFGGTLSAQRLTVSSLQLSGDLNLTRHITAGGPTPSRSNGSALGSGGTSSISGSDTSGSITINTGNGPSAGCFLTVNFTNKFNSTPHVLLTPVGSSAAALNYYVNRSTSSFSVCSTNAATANSNFGFDYFILD